MAYTTINKPNLYFNTVLYTGTGSSRNQTGVGFDPDWVWIKSRSNAYNNNVWDRVRGAGQRLITNDTGAEETQTGDMSAFVTDGITVGAGNITNANGATFVMWNWLAGGTGVSNTQGTISSTVSANTTSGFSIVSYTGDGVNNRTVGHGLGATPKFIIIKNRSAGTAFWSVINPRSTSTTDTNILYLNRTDAEADDTNIMGTNLPNSTTFGIGNYAGVNVNAQNFIAYCFAPIKGYSAMGQYTGNGSTDGPFIYTGFKPAFVLAKRATTAGEDWTIYDNKRNEYNVVNKVLYPDSAGAEATAPNTYDFLSNGFKLRSSDGRENLNGATFIYMAFAENPFVSSTLIPTTAR